MKATEQQRGWAEEGRKRELSHDGDGGGQRNEQVLEEASAGVQRESRLQEKQGRAWVAWILSRTTAHPIQFKAASASPQGFSNSQAIGLLQELCSSTGHRRNAEFHFVEVLSQVQGRIAKTINIHALFLAPAKASLFKSWDILRE